MRKQMTEHSRDAGSAGEIFGAFLPLGLTSFGGPAAHLGYFHREFVERRHWLTARDYADLVALCQFLPGPASSQVGFALGLMRAGFSGALAAWAAFTLPSALVLFLFAAGAALLDGPIAQGVIHGLKVTAVAIVAHAVWGMARNLCPDLRRAGIALAAVMMAVFIGGSWGQLAAISVGAVAGIALCRAPVGDAGHTVAAPVSPIVAAVAAGLFAALLVGLPVAASLSPSAALTIADAFYRAGALVFGGGHVVLPLLDAELVQSGWVSTGDFLAGYGAAQAIPGPLFTFSAYLGAVISPHQSPLLGAGLALVMIFLPGMLLLVAALPLWSTFRRGRTMQAMMRGANAAVVGILAAALYHPVWTGAILGPYEFALALAGFLLLSVWKWPTWMVVLGLAVGGVAISL